MAPDRASYGPRSEAETGDIYVLCTAHASLRRSVSRVACLHNE